MKHIARTVTEWVKGLRPALMVTVESDHGSRTTLTCGAVKFLVWVFPALVITDWIPSLAAGCDAFVRKPFELDDLEAVIRTYLTNGHA